MSIRDGFVNQAKNAAASFAQKAVTSVADGLKSGLGGSTSNSASSPLQTDFVKPGPILLYPADVGVNPRQASYILFARHSVTGAKVKPVRKNGPTVAPIMTFDEDGAEMTDVAKTREKQRAADEKFTAAQLGTVEGVGGANKGGSSNSLLLQRQNIKRTGTFIGLYMPPSVNVNYAMDYS